METFTISIDDYLEEYLWCNSPLLVRDHIVGQRRWCTEHEAIIQPSPGIFFRLEYDEPSTEESGSYSDYNNGPLVGVRVFPVEKTVIVYEEK